MNTNGMKRRRTRAGIAALGIGLASMLGGCHGHGHYAYHGGHHHGSYFGGSCHSSGDLGLIVLVYGAAALLSWCLN